MSDFIDTDNELVGNQVRRDIDGSHLQTKQAARLLCNFSHQSQIPGLFPGPASPLSLLAPASPTYDTDTWDTWVWVQV